MKKNNFKLNFGFLGFGNCGGQIIKEIWEDGFLVNENYNNCLAVNMSEVDLQPIKEVGIPTFQIGGDGCAHNRALAKEYIEEHKMELFTNSNFQELVNKSDVIFIKSSTGGGSGSGGSVITGSYIQKLIEKPDMKDAEGKIHENPFKNKIIVMLGVFPNNNMSDSDAFKNNVGYLKELSEWMPNYTLIPFYNQEGPYTSENEVHKRVNRRILRVLKTICGFDNHINDTAMIDNNEIKSLLSTPGIINVNYVNKIKDDEVKDDSSISNKLIRDIDTSPYINSSSYGGEVEPTHVGTKIGLIINTTQYKMDKINTRLILDKVVGEGKSPAKYYKNFNITEDDVPRDVNEISVIRTGIKMSPELAKYHKNLAKQHSEVNHSNTKGLFDDVEIEKNEKDKNVIEVDSLEAYVNTMDGNESKDSQVDFNDINSLANFFSNTNFN